MASGFFTKLIAIEHSTVAWLAKEIQKIDGEEPKIASIVDAGVTYIGPVLQIGLNALGDGAAATAVGVIVADAQKDLLTASAVVTDFGATPTAASMFGSIKTNLGSILADTNVTNPTTIAAVNKAINEVGTLGTAIETAVTEVGAAAGA